MTINAYTAELKFWKHSDPGYVAITHVNMNVDNAYFWRTPSGELDLGVLDWAGMGSQCLGHKLWWWLYCADFENFKSFLPQYIDAFIATYQQYGGPQLDKEKLRMMVILTALEQMQSLMNAVPQIMKMC